ncbi:hypothetical protein, partial [Thiolapillus sp.]|uniref:hypothetical protein n=1 Tax=Thiolapillus sp. TaxID=2017437 RepID=UPI003AF43813
ALSAIYRRADYFNDMALNCDDVVLLFILKTTKTITCMVIGTVFCRFAAKQPPFFVSIRRYATCFCA